MKQKRTLSVKQYLAQDGIVCPVCQSTEVTSDDVDRDGSHGTANCQCQHCHSYWVDIWQVVEYSNLNEGMTPKELAEVKKKANQKQDDRGIGDVVGQALLPE